MMNPTTKSSVANSNSFLLFPRFAVLAALVTLAAATPSLATIVPTLSSPLALHYDDSDVSTTGADVDSWNNQGNRGSAADATPVGTQPILVSGAINGRDAIEFSGTTGVDEVLTTGTFTTMSQPNTMFLVLRDDGVTVANPVVIDGVSGGRHFLRLRTGDLHMFAGTSVFGGPALAKGVYRIFSVEYNSPSSAVLVDGAAALGPVNVNTNSLSTFAIGNSPPNSNNLTLDGQFAQILGFDGLLNTAERTIIENHLSAKFDISLDTGGGALDVYAGDTNANGDYDLDVFGIGSLGGADELADSGLVSGLQIAESGSTLDSGDFVMAGHRVETNSITSADLKPGEQRWQRVWYLDQTQSVDTTLTFDWSDAGLGPLDPAFNRLIYSPNDPFSFSRLNLSGTISGDQISFTLLSGQLLDGYYTLAQLQPIPEPSSLMLLGLGCLGLLVRRRRRRGFRLRQRTANSIRRKTETPYRATRFAMLITILSGCSLLAQPVGATPVLSGLELWLNSDGISDTDGNNITTWTGNVNSRNGTAPAGQEPVARSVTIGTTSATIPSFEPAGTLDRFLVNWDPNRGDYTLFVLAATSDTRGVFVAHDAPGWNNLDSLFGVGKMNVFDNGGAGIVNGALTLETHGNATFTSGVENGVTTANGADANGTWRIYAARISGTNYEISIDGGSPFTNLSSESGFFGAGAGATNFEIGAGQNSLANALSGDIAEILIYNGALSATDFNAVGFFLQDKYGLDASFIAPPPIPEPSSSTLLGLGFVAIAARRRRR